MIKLSNISVLPQEKAKEKELVAKHLQISPQKIKSVTLFKKSVDARKKSSVCFSNSYLIDFFDKKDEEKILKKFKNTAPYIYTPYLWKKADVTLKYMPIIVGSGPAGLFAALTLCKAGIPPIIVEKGRPVEQRIKDVENYWKGEKLNPNSNVQFGEGGAGTFSDGKLNTGIKSPLCNTVLEQFYHYGADKDILINAHPHIGTDVLRKVVKNIRLDIQKMGGKYLFETEFIKPIIKSGKVTAAICKNSDGEFELPTENLILALGNSARNTFKQLYNCGINIMPKPFAIGVRIEHSQESINTSQYGLNYSKNLPPAEYKLATHLPGGKGVYTFCMCPGGVVVNSASEENTYVTNGMSYKQRNLKNANSAVLVGITEKDYAHLNQNSPFGGIYLQEQIEKAAFLNTKGRGLPVQTVGSFLKNKKNNISEIIPSVQPAFYETDLKNILPEFITNALAEALPIMGQKINAFSNESAVLTAPETRSSSPIRIVRNELFSSNISGIYPCGEGAGYAGGITSSAVDGIKTAELICQNLIKK